MWLHPIPSVHPSFHLFFLSFHPTFRWNAAWRHQRRSSCCTARLHLRLASIELPLPSLQRSRSLRFLFPWSCLPHVVVFRRLEIIPIQLEWVFQATIHNPPQIQCHCIRYRLGRRKSTPSKDLILIRSSITKLDRWMDGINPFALSSTSLLFSRSSYASSWPQRDLKGSLGGSKVKPPAG